MAGITITVPIELELTPRSRAVMDALHKVISPQFKSEETLAAPQLNLQPGERYAGVVLDESGQHKHHLVLLAPRPEQDLAWQAAMDWAQSIGGVLPTRQEQALLYANCKPHLKPEWHWSSETHESDASYAWKCHFGYGFQNGNHKGFDGSAVAVRRV